RHRGWLDRNVGRSGLLDRLLVGRLTIQFVSAAGLWQICRWPTNVGRRIQVRVGNFTWLWFGNLRLDRLFLNWCLSGFTITRGRAIGAVAPVTIHHFAGVWRFLIRKICFRLVILD